MGWVCARWLWLVELLANLGGFRPRSPHRWSHRGCRCRRCPRSVRFELAGATETLARQHRTARFDYRKPWIHRWLERPTRLDQRGLALSVWAAVAMVAFIVVIGIAVDFTGHAMTKQDAASVAAQAARAAAQEVDLSPLGERPVINPFRAAGAVRAYLAGSPFTHTMSVSGTHVTVRVSTQYRTQFLSVIGINTLPIETSADVELVRSLNAQER